MFESDEIDQDIKNALETLLEQSGALNTKVESLQPKVDSIEASMATKADIAKLVKAATHYEKHISQLMEHFANGQLSLRDEVQELRSRVEALEKRIPPQAA